jgi:hypothetical protein
MNLTSVLNQVLVTAGDGVGKQGADLFWTSGAGKLIGALLGAAGVVVVLISAFKGFSFITQGKPGMAMKTVVSSIAICIFLFRPETMNDVISLVGSIFQGILGDAETIKATVDCGKDVPSTFGSTIAGAAKAAACQ